MLAHLLGSIRAAPDTSRLFAALGYRRHVERLGDDEWLVARWHGYEVIARDTPRPRIEVRSLAAKLETGSRRALAVAVGGGELVIAAPRLGRGGSTRVLAIPLSHPGPLALRLLQSVRPDGAPNALAHALRVADALSAEGVGERFFAAFRQTLDRMAAALGRLGSASERRTAALLPLTRVLFLYFVQEKGWLDGRLDYLRRLLETALTRRQHFHRRALHPLFFGTLNRRPEERAGSTRRLGTVPYLNGGLFEPHPVERRLGPVTFSNELWRDAFDHLFERFRFCVREADEADAIAPDMLGRVFERVMDEADRHRTGTFYTPEAVVRELVDAALETALGDALPLHEVRRLLAGSPIDAERATRALDLLRQVRLLDPAVGSGALLLGALERLTHLRCCLEPGGAPDRCLLRREILRDNLFGVDLSPLAVRLAELRLWLAIIADDPTADIRHVVPLPNLDGVVRQGDSLLDPIGAARTCFPGSTAPPHASAQAVHAARRALFEARGTVRRDAVADLHRRELALAGTLVDRAERWTGAALRDLASAARSPNLFGRAGGLSRTQYARYRRLRRHRAWLERARVSLAEGQVPFFSFEVHAPEVAAAGGFSIVIGNPPWVRSERLAPELRQALGERFSWWHAGSVSGFSHLPDLSIAFLERALELAAPGGTVAMLVPSKITSSGYAEPARRQLIAETRLTYAHRVPDREAARFGAATYPLMLVLRKEAPRPGDRVRLATDHPEAVAQQTLGGPGPWILVPDHLRHALETLRAAGRPLRELAAPLLGVKTGADKLFVGTLMGRSGESAQVRLPLGIIEVEWELLRPALRGRDLRPFALRLSRVVIWTHHGRGGPLAHLPPRAAAHFRTYDAELRRRADYRNGPTWTLFRVAGEALDHRVVWPDIARRPTAVALDECGVPRAVPLNTCYAVGAPDRETALVVAAVFNSTWARALLTTIADEARGGYRRFNARVAGELPIPPAGPACQRLASLAAEAHATTRLSQDALDDTVAEALDLEPAVRDRLRELGAHQR